MADTTQKTTKQDEQVRTILVHLATAAHFSQQAWIELEKALPDIREACPSFYQAFAELMIGAYQNTQIIEDAGDDLVRDINGVPLKSGQLIPRLSGV